VGLITILDEEVFHNYAGIFISILESDHESEQSLKDKIVSLKSSGRWSDSSRNN
jgi:hypothetical protein